MQHILFDTDGVIVHSDMWSLEYARRSGISSEYMRPFFTGVFQECILGRADLKSEIESFLPQWRYTGGADQYLSEWFHYEHHLDMDLIEKIQKIRKSGIQCHVATNQEKYRLEYLRKDMKFGEYFDSIFCSCEIGRRKPQCEFYEYILKSLNITDPSNVLYFDDSEENILVAKNLGIDAVLYKAISDLENAFLK